MVRRSAAPPPPGLGLTPTLGVKGKGFRLRDRPHPPPPGRLVPFLGDVRVLTIVHSSSVKTKRGSCFLEQGVALMSPRKLTVTSPRGLGRGRIEVGGLALALARRTAIIPFKLKSWTTRHTGRFKNKISIRQLSLNPNPYIEGKEGAG